MKRFVDNALGKYETIGVMPKKEKNKNKKKNCYIWFIIETKMHKIIKLNFKRKKKIKKQF